MLIFSRCLSNLVGEMVGRAEAARTEVEFARPRPRKFDELPQGFCRHRRMHEKHVRDRREARDRCQILHRVVAEVRIQRRTDGDGRGGDHDRVTVGRRRRRKCDRQVAAGAGAIVRHDLLAEALGDFLSQHAADNVARCARGEPHFQTDRFDRIGRRGSLRERARAEQREEQRGDDAQHYVYASNPSISPVFGVRRRIPMNGNCRRVPHENLLRYEGLGNRARSGWSMTPSSKLAGLVGFG